MTNSKRRSESSLPPLNAGSGVRPKANAHTSTDEEIDQSVFALVTAVHEEDGRSYPPEWAAAADAAKRRNYLSEVGLRLYMTKHGEEWLAQRGGDGAKWYTMTKISKRARLALKDLAHETGVPMQEALSELVEAMYQNRDALTRAAHRSGLTHPWEAISKVK